MPTSFDAQTRSGDCFRFEAAEGRFTSITPIPPAPGLPWIMPGFVDAHCHILPTGLDLLKLNLDDCATAAETLEAVADWHAKTDDSQWLMAVHYDQNRFADGCHLTRQDLDKISATRPILLRHVNGHASVANSAALAAAGVTPETPDPAGGTFLRDASGELTGVLLERAHEAVTNRAPKPTVAEMTEAILRAGRAMSKFGITCATDMMTGYSDLRSELTAYRLASEQGCPIRLRLCLQWSEVFGPRALAQDEREALIAEMSPGRCGTIGVKIFADGAIGSATAAINGSYKTTEGQGQLIYRPERLMEMVRIAHEAGERISIHSIGDRSTDLVMSAFEAVGSAQRHRLEHAMILSDDQIERLARLGCFVTMQPEFLIRFGHAYRAQLGPEVASKLKRFRSCLDAGIPLSLSSDRPIVQGDPWLSVRCAAHRPDGFAPEENISEDEAIRLCTQAAADANGDPHQGRLEVGARADYQISADGTWPGSVYAAGEKVV